MRWSARRSRIRAAASSAIASARPAPSGPSSGGCSSRKSIRSRSSAAATARRAADSRACRADSMNRAAIDQHLNEAFRARQAGRAEEARRHLQAVLELEADHPAARNARGLDALAERDPAAAAIHFEAACRADPGAAELWMNLATARAALDQIEAARNALERALDADRRYIPALISLAQLNEQLGEEAQATERWSAVLGLAATMQDRPPQLDAVLEHARSSVERQRARLGQEIDRALSADLAAASARD